jgi:hypothetical protein
MGYDRHACYAQCLENDSYFDDLPLAWISTEDKSTNMGGMKD